MAGSTTKVKIISSASQLIGSNIVQSLADGSKEAELGQALFDDSYKLLLSKHRWRFATKQVQLAKTTSTPIDGRFNNIFQLPLDMVYLQQVHHTGSYEVYGDKLYTNLDVVNIDYTYVANEDMMPSYFIKMFEFYLASQMAIPITGDVNKSQFYSNAYMRAMMEATNMDSTQRPNVSNKSNPFLDVRNT